MITETSNSQESQITKKKALTWSDDDYLEKVYLQPMPGSRRRMDLDFKTTVGPHKSATAFTRASGLSICVPKKSSRNITDCATGINISISKKSVSSSKSGIVVCCSTADMKSRGDAARQDEKRAVKVDIEVPYKKIFNFVRSKLDFLRSKFYSVRNLTSS
ncbi:hypothetical protein O0L34_g5925 [Tuta absoluta]|nr:hypothetical protein O0L34_g5925 [Tuta absoluta]